MGADAEQHHGVADAVVAHPRAVAWLVADLDIVDLEAFRLVVGREVYGAVDHFDDGVALVPIIDDPLTAFDLGSAPHMAMSLVQHPVEGVLVATAEND